MAGDVFCLILFSVSFAFVEASTSLDWFVFHDAKALDGHNDETIGDINEEECARRCLVGTSTVPFGSCLSFDYDHTNGKCILSTSNKDTPGAVLGDSDPMSRFDYYHRKAPYSPCDFDSDLCGYTQDTTDDFNWLRDFGGTPTGLTGPTVDHTTGTSSGHYMYIETSGPRKQGHTARLISPSYSRYPDGQCLLFWTHMYGDHPDVDSNGEVGTLTVSVKDGSTTSDIWTRSGNQGNQWFSVAVSIPATGSYQVIFEAVRGDNAHGDIAIDDVSILQKTCPDVDECVPRGGRGPCSQICTNTVGSFVCSCNVGYTLHQDSLSCNDVDECAANGGRGPCSQICTNAVGGFSCSCEDGYSLNHQDGLSCRDVDECIPNEGRGPCGHMCTNTVGSFSCTCEDGYALHQDGLSCNDVDECAANEGRGPCAQICTNTIGSFSCSCEDGYALHQDGLSCNDVDECAANEGRGPCAQICTNTIGSFSCSCEDGHSLNHQDGLSCRDVDECVPNGGKGPCGQICTNTVGSFFCTCNDGYTLHQDRLSCNDVDECAPRRGRRPCAQICTNTVGSFSCSCNDGYTQDGLLCTDVNECNGGRGPCAHTCTNTVGSYTCSCNEGFNLNSDRHTCDQAQCPTPTAPEHGDVTGGNSYQDEVQFTCDPGYRLIGASSRTCRADGTWTEENPICIDITPTSVKTEALSSTEIELTWSLDNYTDQVKQYFVYVRQRGTNNVTNILVGRSDRPSYTVQNLAPYTHYDFWVVADIGDFHSNRSEIVSQRTQPGEPPAPEKPVLQDQTEVSSTTFPLEVKPTSERNGPIGCYHVVVVKSSSTDNLPDPEMLQTYKTLEEAKNSGNDNFAYIAMALAPDTVGASTTVTVGDGAVTSCKDQAGRKRRALTSNDVYNQEYTNSPLEPGSSYTTSVRAYGQDDGGQPYFSASQYMDPVSTAPKLPPPDQLLIIIIASVCGGVVLLGIIAAALVCYCRKKKATKKADLSKRTGTVNKAIEMAPVDYDNINDPNINDNNIEDADNDNVDNDNAVYDNVPPAPLTDFNTPIPASRLEEVYDHRHMNDNQVFNEEYQSIPEEVSNSHDAHIRPENGNKNRFKNIFTYDHSRVVLTTLEGQPGSDFINANYIDGYNHPNMFVAAQGPLPNTINDFWRMVWEQDTATIVMVTNLKERNKSKCAQYWPNKDSMDYGKIRVTLVETTTLVDYVIRTFDIQKDEEPARTVTQFHFISWPDFGVPQSPLGMMKFIRRAKTSDPPGRGPIVVHCSAGVGRSGTFIAIEAMQEMMAAEGRVDVHGFIGQMRHNRHSMVQTVEQYEFIYRALLEQQLYGDTEVEVANIHRHMHKLKAPSANPNQLGYEAEFKKLTRIPVDQDNMKSANKQENKTKNRLVSIVPYDTSRVFLPKITGVSGSDYINASFIDGYRQRDGFIATQGPLPNTIETFWRMIWHWESYSIVMLTELEENEREKSAKYWPEDGQTYGKVRVELKNTEENEGYTLRTFLVSNTDKQGSPRREIQQFHFHDWSATGVPRNASRVLDLIGQVQKQQMKSGNGPITVHCSNGAGRTGAFIALNTVLERVKAEGICDLFQTVKSMRYSRPHMVQTAEQYLFCYKAVMEYLDSFDDYANFQ